MSDIKGRASRDLNRSGADHHVKRWTRHGSTRHLFDEASVAAAIAYTLDQQGSPMATYDPRKEQKGAAHAVSDSTPDPRKGQKAAHEVSVPPPSDSPSPSATNPLTSCAAPNRSAGRDISELKASEE